MNREEFLTHDHRRSKVCGVIRYETGIEGLTGDTGFAFAYDHTAKYEPETERFHVHPAPGYNYTK